MSEFIHSFGMNLWESVQTLLPILAFFVLFQLLYLKMPRENFVNILKGLAVSLIGLTLFLFGVNYGFLPAGEKMGMILGDLNYRWIMIPTGFLLGFVATLAEPAVRVHCYEIDKASSGNIREKLILFVVALGVAAAVALGMARIIYGFPIHYLIVPGYLLIIICMKFVSSTFIAIAFDSGGVVTGPMITTFVVAITLGAAEVIKGRDPILDGFGLIALVAMIPILVIMCLGLYVGKELDE